jgi:hypothetical protein
MAARTRRMHPNLRPHMVTMTIVEDLENRFGPFRTDEGVDSCPRPTACATDVLVELVLGLVKHVHALEERS